VLILRYLGCPDKPKSRLTRETKKLMERLSFQCLPPSKIDQSFTIYPFLVVQFSSRFKIIIFKN
jgi:hypothetical protein